MKDKLTPREIDVIELLAQGLSNLEIANELHIADRTVQTHLSNIYVKLDVRGRTEAAILWLENTRYEFRRIKELESKLEHLRNLTLNEAAKLIEMSNHDT